MRFVLLLSLVVVSACAPVSTTEPSRARQAECGQPKTPDISVQLDVSQKLMSEGRLHAALAHLDDIDEPSLKGMHLRAESLRKLGRYKEAEPLYSQLVNTCMSGEGHHGLGLIAGMKGNLENALVSLKHAASLLPLDARIRNDYGYALLLDKKYVLAEREFLTAFELDEASSLAQSNLVLLLYLKGDKRKAEAYAGRMNMDRKTLVKIEKQAKELANSKD